MSDFEINKDMQKNSTEKTEELSPEQRKKFKDAFKEELDIFNEVNDLIEEEMEGTTPISTATEPTPPEQTMDMQHSYNDKAQQLKRDLDRLGVINSDPTGKSQKAAGNP
jgi:hypothetical protein